MRVARVKFERVDFPLRILKAQNQLLKPEGFDFFDFEFFHNDHERGYCFFFREEPHAKSPFLVPVPGITSPTKNKERKRDFFPLALLGAYLACRFKS